jgi:hypothetical protein
MPQLNNQKILAHSIEKVFALALALDEYPKILTYVKSVRIHKKSEEHLTELINKEPLWDLLLQDDFVNLLFHLNGHGSILRQTCPNSLEKLAAVLSMIRPAKRYLIGKDWTTILDEVWKKPTTNEYHWKKSHAFSYALLVVMHMNLICEQLTQLEK